MIRPMLAPTDGAPGVPGRPLRPSAGAAMIETVLWAPILVLVTMFAIAGGSLAMVRIEADGAAGAAARAATLERTVGEAEAAALAAAEASLSGRCTDPTVTIDADLAPGGIATVTLTCTVETDTPFLSGRTITATAASPVDPWRGEDTR